MNAVLRSAVLAAIVIAGATPALAQTAKPTKPAAPAKAAAPAGMTDKQQVSTMIGMDIAKSLGAIKDEIDVATLTHAMQLSFDGKPTGLTEAQAEQIRASFQQKLQTKMAAQHAQQSQKNEAEGQAFLAANKSKPGVRSTASGLQYQVIRQGAGPTPKPTDTVRVDYKGTFLDGKTFDSSYDRGEPVEFALNQVIPGWTEGVGLMPVGSKYKFWIPGKLAYGANGQGPIGPNQLLVFEVELKGIVK